MEKKKLEPKHEMTEQRAMGIFVKALDKEREDFDLSEEAKDTMFNNIMSEVNARNQFDFDGDGVPDSAEKERRVQDDIPLSMDAARDAKNAGVYGSSRGRYLTPEEAAAMKSDRMPLSMDEARESKRMPKVIEEGFSDNQSEDSYDFE